MRRVSAEAAQATLTNPQLAHVHVDWRYSPVIKA